MQEELDWLGSVEATDSHAQLAAVVDHLQRAGGRVERRLLWGAGRGREGCEQVEALLRGIQGRVGGAIPSGVTIALQAGGCRAVEQPRGLLGAHCPATIYSELPPAAHLLLAHGSHLWRLLVKVFVERWVLDAIVLQGCQRLDVTLLALPLPCSRRRRVAG